MSLIVKQCSVHIQRSTILDNVNVEIKDTERISVIGPSGAGKTTLLRCIAGLQKHTGTIICNGNDITRVPTHQRQIGYVDQQLNLFPHFTIFENIALPLRIRKLTRPDIRTQVKNILREFSITDIAKRYPQECSGGEQQRAALARSLIYEPTLLLLDEPFGALDIITRMQMMEWLASILSHRAIPLIMVTHDVREARLLCTRSLIIHEGKLHADGTWQQLDQYTDALTQQLLRTSF